ncbi:NAC domain-containing protein 90-like [Rhodamnia argentea]|uniref:NAC domain-containing protein 90-like n=1 Tax=Rhodamnia argentea TaxID=178133 RepID=A0A8B8NIV8_9MYRT|nr:NAC domain-containing protein 90-like [Rhodamnia argentea]XP_030522412.1 NAC domain-containing protein 90-like [Rhodamnia argentea]
MMEDHPTGFRFYPTEEELISFYLHNQLQGSLQDRLRCIIPVLDIYATEPWNLPELSGELCREDKEQWFFFAPMQESEARGGRPSRSTAVGYWKATGSPGYVYSSDSKVIGTKKSMVFYVGKAPTGKKTKWKLNECRALETISPPNSNSSSSSMPVFRLRLEYALCRVYAVSGSSRAFDRRRLELVPGETLQGGDGGRGSCSGGGGSISPSGSVIECDAGISGYVGTISMKIEGQIWDWDQLNWF